jgi:hypothetical protein
MARPKYLWIGYTILFWAAILASYLTPHSERNIYDLIDIALTLIAAFGLVCFTFKQQFIHRIFLKC